MEGTVFSIRGAHQSSWALLDAPGQGKLHSMRLSLASQQFLLPEPCSALTELQYIGGDGFCDLLQGQSKKKVRTMGMANWSHQRVKSELSEGCQGWGGGGERVTLSQPPVAVTHYLRQSI